jgi:hypothetical protein
MPNQVCQMRRRIAIEVVYILEEICGSGSGVARLNESNTIKIAINNLP